MNHPALENALQEANAGRLQKAIAAVRILINRDPKWSEALMLMGVLLQRDAKTQQALHFFERAARLQPFHPIVRTNYANALLQAGKGAAAIGEFKEVLRLDPGDQPAWQGLVMAQISNNDKAAALESGAQALRRWPDWAELAQIQVNGLLEASRVDDALSFAAEWLREHPRDAGVLATYAYARNFRGDSPELIAQTHRELGALVAVEPSPPRPLVDPKRPLRLGVLSGDLREHSVAYYIDAVLQGLPRDFSCVVFSTLRADPKDHVTRRFRELVPDWIEVGDLNSEGLDQCIRAREIDVLLELSGYTQHSRLPMLARKPAPVIVHAIGYPNTTGLPAVDWRVVDSITDPPSEPWHGTERLLRLDPCFLCYRPPTAAPDPEFPAAGTPLTFGSFNNDAKIGPETLAIWSRVLEAAPGSRLLLKSRALADPTNFSRFSDRLQGGGISPERVELVPFAPSLKAHLALYQRVHIALDPTPYNGTTTTCEALWMGVPVITLEGDRHVSRVGASLLRAAGFPEFIARDADNYCTLALELAEQTDRLGELRTTLRAQLMRSALLQGEAYAERFFAGLRQTWEIWCSEAGE